MEIFPASVIAHSQVITTNSASKLISEIEKSSSNLRKKTSYRKGHLQKK
jgi:hypothetical protein